MNIVNLIQGTPEWHTHRAKHFNASDAPAMMGCSPYETRTELLTRLKTGRVTEVDAGTQRRFDDGHRFEALARPIAEGIIGEALYPVTATKGQLSASFDGVTMDEATLFEHKTLNDALRYTPWDEGNGDHLPLHYRVQMEHQIMVSGADRVLFMASKWAGNDLSEERHCWYASDPKLQAEILNGWDQFAIDLEAFEPTPQATQAVGRTPETLPALRVEVTGMVTASNLAEYKAHALEVFKGINKTLTSDQDFADAEKAVKWCGDVESRLDAAKEHALGQTASIDELFKAIDDIKAEARSTRLELEKLVKRRKDEIRDGILAASKAAFSDHVASLNKRLAIVTLPLIVPDFVGVMKGKRTVESLQNACDTELARVKIEANALADKMQSNLTTVKAQTGYEFLFADLQAIASKAPDDLAALIQNRITMHRAAEVEKAEAMRAKIAAEEKAKAEREALETARAETARLVQIERESSAREAIAAERASKAAPQAGEKQDPAQKLPVAFPAHKATRPTDAQIIEVLALHYRVHESKVIEWLLELDLDTA